MGSLSHSPATLRSWHDPSPLGARSSGYGALTALESQGQPSGGGGAHSWLAAPQTLLILLIFSHLTCQLDLDAGDFSRAAHLACHFLLGIQDATRQPEQRQGEKGFISSCFLPLKKLLLLLFFLHLPF